MPRENSWVVKVIKIENISRLERKKKEKKKEKGVGRVDEKLTKIEMLTITGGTQISQSVLPSGDHSHSALGVAK